MLNIASLTRMMYGVVKSVLLFWVLFPW